MVIMNLRDLVYWISSSDRNSDSKHLRILISNTGMFDFKNFLENGFMFCLWSYSAPKFFPRSIVRVHYGVRLMASSRPGTLGG